MLCCQVLFLYIEYFASNCIMWTFNMCFQFVVCVIDMGCVLNVLSVVYAGLCVCVCVYVYALSVCVHYNVQSFSSILPCFVCGSVAFVLCK